MDDLEITRLCAEAMGLGPSSDCVVSGVILKTPPAPNTSHHYDPLHYDAQCMALVKRFRLRVNSLKDVLWEVETDPRDDLHQDVAHADLNTAIVYCVAYMQAAKK